MKDKFLAYWTKCNKKEKAFKELEERDVKVCQNQYIIHIFGVHVEQNKRIIKENTLKDIN